MPLFKKSKLLIYKVEVVKITGGYAAVAYGPGVKPSAVQERTAIGAIRHALENAAFVMSKSHRDQVLLYKIRDPKTGRKKTVNRMFGGY